MVERSHDVEAPAGDADRSAMRSAVASREPQVELDAFSHAELLTIFNDAAENIRFAKAHQWRMLIYFSALCVGAVAVGVWLRWGDRDLIAFIFYLIWFFSVGTIACLLALQNWQSAEQHRQEFVRGHFTEIARMAMRRKSRLTGDIHRYLMLGMMMLYVELATFAVSRMLWPHF